MMVLFRILIIGFLTVFLSACAVVQSSSIENMGENDRVVLLTSKTDEQLCNAYNNAFLKPNTEKQIEKILRGRKIGRCDALFKVRAIPLELNSIGSLANNAPLQKMSTNSSTQLHDPKAASSNEDAGLREKARPVPAAETSVETVKTTSAFGTNSNLRDDIEVLRKERISKDSFESNLEYRQRQARLIEKYRQSKSYRIVLDVNNAANKKDKMVYFDPDSGVINIVLPETSSDYMHMDVNGENTLKWLYYSFIEVEALDLELSGYTASNRLGTSVKVLKTSKTSYGIAVLSQATRNYSKDRKQSFAVRASKEDAKALLEEGKVILEVLFDYRYPHGKDGINPYLMEKVNESPPSFDYPIHTKVSRYAIPVRLLAVSLQNKDGVDVFRAAGQQVDGEAIVD